MNQNFSGYEGVSLGQFVRMLPAITNDEEFFLVATLIDDYSTFRTADYEGYVAAVHKTKQYLRECAAWGSLPACEPNTGHGAILVEVMLELDVEGQKFHPQTHATSSAIH